MNCKHKELFGEWGLMDKQLSPALMLQLCSVLVFGYSFMTEGQEELLANSQWPLDDASPGAV